MMANETPTSSLALRLYAALAEGDAAALAELLTADFHGVVTAGLGPGIGGEHHGPDAMREDAWWAIGRRWSARAEPDDFRVLDDGRLLVDGHYRGSGRRSGRPLEARFVHLITVTDGRISRLEQLTDSALFAEALGPEGRFETIDYRVADGVARLRLNRPGAGNAIDLRMAEETLAAARLIEDDERVRAVLITGAGDAFTVGGDIDYFLSTAEPGSYGRLFERMTRPFHDAFRILDRIEAPIVTAVRGSVAGGGLGYLFTADLCLASENARFVTAFAGIALSGDGGGTWHLPRLVGTRKAKELYLLNRPLAAAEALDAGLVNEVVPDEELDARALALATRLAQGPTRAYGLMRDLLNHTWDRDLSAQLRAETRNVAEAGDTKDAAEGIAAFREKRAPTFEGH
jgi:2-(1,2-epoxy-1,2-dihydrophenyl)acetyl-CoA isomerase